MSICQKRTARRLSVWLLIFSILILTAVAALPMHAMPVADSAGNMAREAGDAVGDMARDAADGVGDAMHNAADNVKNGEGGKVTDDDGVIGNEASNAEDATTDTQSKVGRVALIVVIVAIVIAVIIIVLLIPKKKKD